MKITKYSEKWTAPCRVASFQPMHSHTQKKKKQLPKNPKRFTGFFWGGGGFRSLPQRPRSPKASGENIENYLWDFGGVLKKTLKTATFQFKHKGHRAPFFFLGSFRFYFSLLCSSLVFCWGGGQFAMEKINFPKTQRMEYHGKALPAISVKKCIQ